MFRYVQAFSTIGFAAVVYAVIADGLEHRVEFARWGWLLFVLVVMPGLVVTGFSRVLHLLRPRRVFDGAQQGTRRAVLLGGVTGVLAVTATAFAAVWLGGSVSDTTIHTATSGLSVLLVLTLFDGGRIPGRCIGCDYDITSSLQFGRCPECGHPLHA